MAAYRLTRRAAADLEAIFEYTSEHFGVEQGHSCLSGPHEWCGRLAANPHLGRGAGSLAPGLRRHEFRSHVVFYVAKSEGVLIVRVLHQRMDAARHVDHGSRVQ